MTKTIRSLLFALLSFVFVSEAAAQSPQVLAITPPVTFSVAGGFNMSRLSFSLPFDDEVSDVIDANLYNRSRFGVVVGGLVDFRVAPGISVVSGGLMSTRGGSLEFTIPDLDLGGIDLPDFGSLDVDTSMIYVDVPAFVAVGVAGAGQNRFEAIGGAMIGFKAHARQKVSGFGMSADEEITDELPAVDFGLSIGGRYTHGHIFAAAYYTWSLTDLTDGDAAEPIKHRYLTVLGGWRF